MMSTNDAYMLAASQAAADASVASAQAGAAGQVAAARLNAIGQTDSTGIQGQYSAWIASENIKADAARLAAQLEAAERLKLLETRFAGTELASKLQIARENLSYQAWEKTQTLQQQMAQFRAQYGLDVAKFNQQKQAQEAQLAANPSDWVAYASYLHNYKAPDNNGLFSPDVTGPGVQIGYTPPGIDPYTGPTGGTGTADFSLTGGPGQGSSFGPYAPWDALKQYQPGPLPSPTLVRDRTSSAPGYTPELVGVADGGRVGYGRVYRLGGAPDGTPRTGDIRRNARQVLEVFDGRQWISLGSEAETLAMASRLQAITYGTSNEGTAGYSAANDRPPGADGPVRGPNDAPPPPPPPVPSGMGTAGFDGRNDKPNPLVSGAASATPAPGGVVPTTNQSVVQALAQTAPDQPAAGTVTPTVTPAAPVQEENAMVGIPGANEEPQTEPIPPPPGSQQYSLNGQDIPGLVYLPGANGAMDIYRRAEDGAWEPVLTLNSQGSAQGSPFTPAQPGTEGDNGQAGPWETWLAQQTPDAQKVWQYGHGQTDNLDGVNPGNLSGAWASMYAAANNQPDPNKALGTTPGTPQPVTNPMTELNPGVNPNDVVQKALQAFAQNGALNTGYPDIPVPQVRQLPPWARPRPVALAGMADGGVVPSRSGKVGNLLRSLADVIEDDAAPADMPDPGAQDVRSFEQEVPQFDQQGPQFDQQQGADMRGSGPPDDFEGWRKQVYGMVDGGGGAGQTLVVGEYGPEVIYLPPGAEVRPTTAAPGMGGQMPMYDVAPANSRAQQLLGGGERIPMRYDITGAADGFLSGPEGYMGGSTTPMLGVGSTTDTQRVLFNQAPSPAATPAPSAAPNTSTVTAPANTTPTDPATAQALAGIAGALAQMTTPTNSPVPAGANTPMPVTPRFGGAAAQNPTDPANPLGYSGEALRGMPWLQNLVAGTRAPAFSAYGGPLSLSQNPALTSTVGTNFPALPAPHQISGQVWLGMNPTEQAMALGAYRALGIRNEDVLSALQRSTPGTVTGNPTAWRV